jgi:hypothetical protein
MIYEVLPELLGASFVAMPKGTLSRWVMQVRFRIYLF